jgi:NSS family neurotransmitter:Na+ symporter
MRKNDERAAGVQTRERLGSRLGFILLSAGCAIGLGNVWRFPYLAGQYGGASFVFLYIVFLVVFGLPIMSMEFAVGRGSRQSVARAFSALEPKGAKWRHFAWFAMAGNYLLMMFYTTISGWILAYLVKMARGDFVGLSPQGVSESFAALTSDAAQCVIWMVVVCVFGFLICSIGLKNSVERVAKVMMVVLLFFMVALAARSVTLDGAVEGVRFYLTPSLEPFRKHGVWTVMYNALGQAFFTLSLGVGSMAIFGSYIGRERRLFGESVNVAVLDTFVALMAGIIIFPACFAFKTDPGAGPGLVFVTLPNIFNAMPFGRLWGTLFFVFLMFAAFSTIIAVFENIIAFAMDMKGWSRRKASFVNMIAIPLLSLPCALGFSVWSGFQPLGAGSGVLDLEDFIVSNNLLPLGSIVFVLFCTCKRGWGWENFMAEVNAGKGLRFPARLRIYCKYVLPLVILAIFICGYINMFLA